MPDQPDSLLQRDDYLSEWGESSRCCLSQLQQDFQHCLH